MTSSETVSVVIRVRNEGPALRKVLSAVKAQRLAPLEIIVVDNESLDDTREVALDYGAKILDISRAAFTYGKALNIGIRAASGEFICILSAHSLPIGPAFLDSAVAVFSEPNVAAVRCLSVTNRRELENWTTSSALAWPVEIEKVVSTVPVNCAAMIRRSVWEQIPYDESLVSIEDKFWALQVLKSGYQIRSSAATYLYLRDFGFRDKVRVLHRDRLQFYRSTGKIWQEPPVSLSRLLRDTLFNIPRRAIRAVIYEVTLYARLKMIPYQGKRRQKS